MGTNALKRYSAVRYVDKINAVALAKYHRSKPMKKQQYSPEPCPLCGQKYEWYDISVRHETPAETSLFQHLCTKHDMHGCEVCPICDKDTHSETMGCLGVARHLLKLSGMDKKRHIITAALME